MKMPKSIKKQISLNTAKTHYELLAACEKPTNYPSISQNHRLWIKHNIGRCHNSAVKLYKQGSKEYWTKVSKKSNGSLNVWSEPNGKKIILSDDTYIVQTINWTKCLLEDKSLFPVYQNQATATKPDKDYCEEAIKEIYLRLYKVYLIIGSSYNSRRKAYEAFHRDFSFFLYFGWYWELLPLEDLPDKRRTKNLTLKIRARYLKTKTLERKEQETKFLC